MSPPESNEDAKGLGGLPKSLRVAVELVSTFGLAVFLVLYYVLWIRPEENKRYEELQSSVNALIDVVENEYTLVPSDLERKLEKLYTLVVADELADLPRGADTSAESLAASMNRVLTTRTQLLQGFARKDGRSLSELLSNKLHNFELHDELARLSLGDWNSLGRPELKEQYERFLEHNLGFIASAK